MTIGAGNVTGAIGTSGGNKLKEVNFNGASNVTSIDATTVKISNVAANVTATEQISGAVSYTADGKLTANNRISGSVTTATNDTGILIFSRNGSVTDNIGENGAALEKVIFKGVDTIEGAAYAQTFTIANANVTVKGLMTGNVNYEADGTLAPEGIIGDIDFKGTNGTFSMNDGRAIDGAVLRPAGLAVF
ncbi:hypothetical protein N7281_01125 [Rickettsia hoogstraalii]|uniref:hypothetical protein n=1 Tax=Rickettsia hoogstraalii TaxID=467174 RepID=UPI00224F24E6|nr:hypothetical protein [Rickettsia hoogstraalii]MCX4083502.1 hypothetical protein [Rickettsia hoogstraalii]